MGTGTTATASGPTGVLELKVPAQSVLPDGAFSIVARHSAGKPVTVTASPAGVCRAESKRIRPLAAGTCVVSATADGTSVNRSVRIVKGTPKISWALKGETRNSFAYRPHGIRTSSDGQWTARSLTTNQCAIKGSMIAAVAVMNTSSLGMCRVQVDVAGTARWLPARLVLKTRIVESVLSFAVSSSTDTVEADVPFEVKVRMTYPDSSLDGYYGLDVSGCGVSVFDREDSNRTRTFKVSSTAADLKRDTDSGHCTLTVHAGVAGTLQLLGEYNIRKTLAVSL
ncbi:hypothetical protein EV645_6508 [Kribbella rubisoli]|uniref:Ig-like domain-containing protein n=1 Tax=Kribbella rubisoli TaxID=3075929 RepID=A0A4Q7WML8_9ACTN|nr:hypothetical protein [Kribbella rubisoli]RZU11342.1 hypothetical protein EV645_6508 [Kribbella rubisoli]